MKIVVNQSCQDEMNAHAEETFPEECCGTMLGRELEDGSREIVQIIRVENTKGENRERRFLIDPRSLLAAERTAKEAGLDVLGIYHSHPDHPSENPKSGGLLARRVAAQPATEFGTSRRCRAPLRSCKFTARRFWTSNLGCLARFSIARSPL